MGEKIHAWLRIAFAAIVLASTVACQHRAPKPPEYWLDVTLVDIRPGEMHLLEQTYDLTLRIQNPHNFDIDANGMRFTVDSNGKEFARGVGNQQSPIPRLGETVVKVKAVSDASRVAAQIGDWRNIATNGFSYRIYGRVFAPDWTYPFDYQGQFDPNAMR